MGKYYLIIGRRPCAPTGSIEMVHWGASRKVMGIGNW